MRIISVITLPSGLIALLLSVSSFSGDGPLAPKNDLYVGRVTDSGFSIDGWQGRNLIISKIEGDERVISLISPDEIIVSKKDGEIVLHYIPKGQYGHADPVKITAPAPVVTAPQPTAPGKDLYVGRYTDNGFLITERLANGHLVATKVESGKNVVKKLWPSELIVSKKNGEIVLHWVPDQKNGVVCNEALTTLPAVAPVN